MDDEASPRVVLKDVRPGEYFGELSLFDDKPRSASALPPPTRSSSSSPAKTLARYLGRSQNAAMSILSEMAERLRETNAHAQPARRHERIEGDRREPTWGQRLADKVAELNGSWTFILFLIALTFAWFLINTP